ncbi:MAG TPA: hypothetical protein VGK92_11625 [Gaiellales bacterium]|jgi:hypothetical protein
MRALPACLALIVLLALPAAAAAHTIKGLVHDDRDVILAQAPGAHAGISADGTHLVLRRDGARVVEVLDFQGLPALKLDARGGWARKGAPIVTVLAVTPGAPDPRDARWLRVGDGSSLRFHYPGTHGEVVHRWSVPLRVDGRPARIRGAVERAARPPLAWPIGAGAALLAGAAALLLLPSRRRLAWPLVGFLAVAAIAIAHGESAATGARPWGVLVAAVVALAGLALAHRLRRDAALEQGALAVTAILLALPLAGRLAVLRHGVIVTTLDGDLVRALVVAGLAAAAAAIGAAARAWWPETG